MTKCASSPILGFLKLVGRNRQAEEIEILQDKIANAPLVDQI